MPLSIAAGNELTIYQAAQLRAQLEQALLSGEDIRLELSAVEEIDCAGAQLLLWLQREGLRLARSVALHAPSQAVSNFILLMGMQRDLRLETAEEHGDGP